MPTQLLIDGHSLLFRAYHALPPLTTRAGLPTGAIHGFSSMLLRVVDEESPDRLVVVFDAPQATFRHLQFEAYKAQREETPDDLRQQMPYLQDLLAKLGVPVLSVGGYEADDTLGTLAAMGAERGFHSLIVTGDRDLLQLAGPAVTILLTSRSGISDLDRMDRDAVKVKMGVWPEQVPDLKGLMGDGSDNIPGVAGIGPKSAITLLDQYQTVDNIFLHLDDLTSSRWQKALRGHEEEAKRYRDLATIVTEVPIEWPCVEEPFHWQVDSALVELLNELELNAVKRRLKVSGELSSPTTHYDNPSTSLFEIIPMSEEQFDWHNAPYLGVYSDGNFVWVYHPGSHGVLKRGLDLAWPADVRLAGWGVKELYRQAFEQGRACPTFVADIKLEAYLLNSERRDFQLHSLLDDLNLAHPKPDTGESAAAVCQLTMRQQAELEQQMMGELYSEVELPLARVLAKMEAKGVSVNRERLQALGRELSESITQVEQHIFNLGGERFNVNSPSQLGEVLFGRLGLPAAKRTKTGYSTDAETLESLRPLHPIVEQILLYRQLVKIQGTYVEGLLPLICPDDRIHTTFHQTVAATGRLSSSDPNLQNIPVRLPLGRRVRGVFVPSSGRTFLAADYSQVELRVLAHLAGDENLLQAFRDGEDIHRRTASEIFNIPLNEVDATWRSRAKAVNFGIIYGISDFGLARDTGVGRSEAHDYIERYFQRYPALRRYFDGVVEEARDQGFVSTILGRRRPLPDIRAHNRVRRQYAERMAMNTVIQGSAADLIKVAMLRIDAAMAEAGLASDMILQVHDELIWDAVPDELEQLAQLATKHMSSAMTLTVPLVVEFKRGETWESVAPWNPRGTGDHHA